jgi:hypothetical protein
MDENPAMARTPVSSLCAWVSLPHPVDNPADHRDRKPLRLARGEGSRASRERGRAAIPGEISWTRF